MRKFFPLILIMAMLLTSCSRSPEETGIETQPSISSSLSTSDTMVSETSIIIDHINESLSSNILLDADLIYPSSSVMNIFPVEIQSFAIDRLEDFFLVNDSIVDQKSDSGYDFITTKNQSTLSRNEFSFEFLSSFAANYLSNVVNWTFYMEFGSLNITDQTTDLDFSTRSDIEARFLSDLEKLGNQKSVHTEIYSMTYQEMSAIEEIMVKSGEYTSEIEAGLVTPKESWDTSDDCYIITAELSPNGITPVLNVEVPLGEYTWIDPSYIWAVYSERGIEFFHVEHPYTCQTDLSKQISTISVDTAKQVVNDKLSSILTNNQYTIDRMGISYIPRTSEGALELIPVWIVNITEKYKPEEGKISKGDEESINQFMILIDAETGKEIR